jgi:hypothetical protein
MCGILMAYRPYRSFWKKKLPVNLEEIRGSRTHTYKNIIIIQDDNSQKEN